MVTPQCPPRQPFLKIQWQFGSWKLLKFLEDLQINSSLYPCGFNVQSRKQNNLASSIKLLKTSINNFLTSSTTFSKTPITSHSSQMDPGATINIKLVSSYEYLLPGFQANRQSHILQWRWTIPCHTLASTASISAVNQKPSKCFGHVQHTFMSHESWLLQLLLGIGEGAHPVWWITHLWIKWRIDPNSFQANCHLNL